ncbi:MAG TPA: Fe-Mn family superoxide dismutase [Candidatus Baltobacteraceae bacterium]|jgi:Fe-Mn family superoxide dismutase|nr:Fe-Mn family superoxide dismutase [Candidatus Baltobacteraceae bacterium]
MKTYTPRKWDLSPLQGISEATLETHFTLYEGYVKNTNRLIEETSQARSQGQAMGVNPQYSELVRRMGWEFNGMRLHEYYFDNLTTSPRQLNGGGLYEVLGESFGEFEAWRKDFFAVGEMRGVGWAIAFYDPSAGQISNHWVEQHQNGNLAGFQPIVVMDCWEHAFIKDYKPSERGKYIDAFYANLNWDVCEQRLSEAQRLSAALSTAR